jgi:hypothetical protein
MHKQNETPSIQISVSSNEGENIFGQLQGDFHGVEEFTLPHYTHPSTFRHRPDTLSVKYLSKGMLVVA